MINLIVHKPDFKKMLITAMFVMCTWLVYGGDFYDYNYFDVKAKIVKVYPNPATTLVNFEFNQATEKNYNLQIFSFTGKKMYDQPFMNGKVSTITLGNDFFRGIYYYKLTDNIDRVVETGKFQVVK